MVPFLYPRKNHPTRLPHSQASKHFSKHARLSFLEPETSTASTTSTSVNLHHQHHPDTQDLETYATSLHSWTLHQLRASVPHTTRALSRVTSSHTTASATFTVVSPLYPATCSLYDCSVRTPRLSAGSGGEGDVNAGYGEGLGDVGETPCNTPREKGLRRRSTVVAAKGRMRVKEEVCGEGEGQARLRPVELVRSLSCGG